MKKSSFLWIAILVLWALPAAGQYKPEREHRVKKSQFPAEAVALVEAKIPGVRRKRYYRETDSSEVRYRVRFRKDRLHYRGHFDKEGLLHAIDISITATDIPDESMGLMRDHLDGLYDSYKIRDMRQQYIMQAGESLETFLRNTFQNLILPDMRYELQVSGKKSGGSGEYEFVFDAGGKFIRKRIMLPPNYDHILY